MNLNFCLFEICWSHLGDIRSYGGRLGVIQDSLGHFRAVGSYQVQAEALTLIRSGGAGNKPYKNLKDYISGTESRIDLNQVCP